MTSVLWMLFVVCPLVLSESGDDESPDGEIVTCSSILTLKQTNLTCLMNTEITEDFKVKLCTNHNKTECVNATLGRGCFTFPNLAIIRPYQLQVQIGEEIITRQIKLNKFVQIPAPEIKLATYIEDTEESFIQFKHKHDYVKKPQFQVEIVGPRYEFKEFTSSRNITISRDRLAGDGVYFVRVRAKPVDFFDGDWSKWSPEASFTVKTKPRTLELPVVIYIIITISIMLMFILGLGALRWRTHIKNYIRPNIPHPKATLAHMHRAKEGLPFTFSPEIFSDVFIHRVDYIDEKPSAPELQEDLDEYLFSQADSSSSQRTSACERKREVDEWLPREQSHLKIRLLDESEVSKERESGVCQCVTAPQRECKDEAYVTMSSLFKTQ